MKSCHSHVKSRQQQAQHQGGVPKHPDGRGGHVVHPPVLWAGHEIAQIRRGQIPQRQTVHQQPHAPGQEPLAELVRPLCVLEQRKGRGPGAGNILLHRSRRQETVNVNGVQPLLHLLHQVRSRQPLNVGNGHIGKAPPPHQGLIQPQLRRAHVPPDEAGVGPHRLGEGVLRPLDGILHLRCGQAPLLPCFHLKGNGSHTGEKHHTEAVNQLLRHGIQILAGVGHRVVHLPSQGQIVQLLHSLALEMLRNGPHNVFRRIRPGNQAINHIGVQPEAAAHQLPGNEVSRPLKNTADIFIGHGTGIHRLRSWRRLLHHSHLLGIVSLGEEKYACW
ncbi:unknown [Firmicutes bacterium CAG:137]|nr:unknown [Firmicutes bacterium CAG:137]